MSTTTAVERGCFISGRTEPLEGEALEVRDPASGALVGRTVNADAATVERAVRAAHEAFAAWSARSVADRGAVMRAGADLLVAHIDELAPGLTAEQGKPLREAKLDLHRAAETLEHYAGLAKELRGGSVHGLDAGVEGRVLRRPLGVVAAIAPWNFPTTLLCNKLGPA